VRAHIIGTIQAIGGSHTKVDIIAMKISKQILLIALVFIIFFASGCSKSFFQHDDAESGSRILAMDDSLEDVEEKIVEEDILPGPYEKPGPPRNFGTAQQGMPGDGYTGSFIAEPFSDGVDEEKIPDHAEPFPSEKGGDIVASLPQEEEVRSRLLPYRFLDHLKEINFAFDRYDFDSKSRAILESNVAYLKTHPILKIEIQGHCDERGTNSYNISLGERRAQSTKSYLVSLGIDESRIRTISYGEEKPFCFESNEICWYQNRTAHFLISLPFQSHLDNVR